MNFWLVLHNMFVVVRECSMLIALFPTKTPLSLTVSIDLYVFLL